MVKNDTICVIPARGGSSRLKHKNLVDLAGKPLLAWTIEAAKSADLVGRTFVSTNDEEIAAVSRQFGCEVIPRPEELSGPMDTSESALLHALNYVRKNFNLKPILTVFLQATSPLRAIGEVDNAIKTLQHENADSLFSAGRVPGFAWIKSDNVIRPVNYDPLKRPRTQDLEEEVVFENGSIYVFKTDLIRESGCRLGGKVAIYIQRPEHSYEIDDIEDLQWIRRLSALTPDDCLAE